MASAATECTTTLASKLHVSTTPRLTGDHGTAVRNVFGYTKLDDAAAKMALGSAARVVVLSNAVVVVVFVAAPVLPKVAAVGDSVTRSHK